MPQHVRPAADDAVTPGALRTNSKNIAIELAARLVAEHRQNARL
jgi:hypothetical protein